MTPELPELQDLAVRLGDHWSAEVLIIVDAGDGIVAACTEADVAEIRGLMFRAGTALPERFTA